ncbi:Carbohydrate-binding-like fold [Thalictrum thalictroides]|uniref:Carbohydrate-binding-like fold n=1 Tax=Thalictrum thalictroides TaxID=46969 RepID=A0A7J6VE53_THATH|nr:Carbohydrate-binding-like fold [Thalictrum thalictroides]
MYLDYLILNIYPFLILRSIKDYPCEISITEGVVFWRSVLLVGDDPSIGQWIPASAVPLNWSDEHIWTVELDLPVGQSIHFKFILKNAKEELFWQPGTDRVLQTWETKNTIVVLDWENAEIQNKPEEPNKNLIATQN